MLNKVTLIGNFGADPEIRYMPNGTATAVVSIATTRRWKDKQTNEAKTETEWHRTVFFGRQAEIVGEYLKKGSKVYVEGRLRTRKWQGQDGKDNYTTEIIVGEFHMLDGKQEGSSNGGSGRTSNGGQQKTNADYSNMPPEGPSNFDDFDDDLPF